MEKERKISTLAIAILVVFVIVALFYFVLSDFWSQDKNDIDGEEYYTVSVSEAYDLINKSQKNEIELTIVDCRGLEGCSLCQYNRGHLPDAVRNDNPLTLYNLTKDILVYSVNGSVGEDFCKELVGHVYGKIYNLEGGWEAWKEHNKTYGWPPIEK